MWPWATVMWSEPWNTTYLIKLQEHLHQCSSCCRLVFIHFIQNVHCCVFQVLERGRKVGGWGSKEGIEVGRQNASQIGQHLVYQPTGCSCINSQQDAMNWTSGAHSASNADTCNTTCANFPSLCPSPSLSSSSSLSFYSLIPGFVAIWVACTPYSLSPSPPHPPSSTSHFLLLIEATSRVHTCLSRLCSNSDFSGSYITRGRIKTREYFTPKRMLPRSDLGLFCSESCRGERRYHPKCALPVSVRDPTEMLTCPRKMSSPMRTWCHTPTLWRRGGSGHVCVCVCVEGEGGSKKVCVCVEGEGGSKKVCACKEEESVCIQG